MIDPALLKRITVRQEVFGGKPIIRDMRLSIELILSLLAQGVPPVAIVEDYPELDRRYSRLHCLCTRGYRP
jgi:uncharacterized protein (DUF433 family)